ncbi:MAG: N-6 DNA methylase [Planctomycetes bacterium]|nr:N-6 DNA methylase [Planctomycetota bacterium]
MLDTETKSRIDSARDILVGKVPDPKSQVEQITIALIYKFMDDMDRQSEELGGKSSFFKGEFKKYRWSQLLDKRFGGHERLLLYAEGIERMNENKNIPLLFRDIFKGVFLPYRDPETLNLFLKEINGFTYDHSERLGDAYEYLLSVLGTQGAAGQFRTPRHIIDFIVAIVDPQKHETVLDPACGTAGFLISAYKHILRHNENLTPDERGRLMTSFCGYDIAPDMVRLSRVNLYLHGFPQPVIHEYDTLTSEERWDERSDVIMANPPFMTPKGGIRPHSRFSIKANRSEVLFVDYIAEHLNPGGRAGVIVPEGIIFQSQNAYKNLRKMLVENYLWAVVSLPAGVFNPYSGVKTSILFLDRNLARRTGAVLFVKVENDGFDLGAQRRSIEENDLPEALEALLAWKNSRKKAQEAQKEMALAVSRKRLLGSPDCNLSGDRYRAVAVRENGKLPMVKLGDVCTIKPPKSELDDLDNALEVSFVPMSAMRENQPTFEATETKTIQEVIKGYTYFRDSDVLVAKITPCFENGKAGIARALRNGIGFGSTEFIVLRPDNKRLLPELLYYFIASEKFRSRGVAHMTGSAGQQRVAVSFVQSYEIPLPPLVEQVRLVAELEGYRKVIEAARQILAHYKPILRIDPKWPEAELRALATFKNGVNYLKENKGKGIKVIGVGNFQDNLVAPQIETLDEINPKGVVTEDDLLHDGDVLFVRSNGNKALVGRSLLVRTKGERVTHSAFTIRLRFVHQKTLPMFYALLFKNAAYRTQLMGRGANINNLSQDILRNVVVPVPPLADQRQIVDELESERALVEANRELIARFEKKLQAKLAEIWGEEEDGRKEPQDAQKDSA